MPLGYVELSPMRVLAGAMKVLSILADLGHSVAGAILPGAFIEASKEASLFVREGRT